MYCMWKCVTCRVLHRLDGLLKTVAAEAMEVTQVVCSAQNVIRKKFVSDLKRSMSDALQVKKDWQQVIVQLTHERSAVSLLFVGLMLFWYCVSSCYKYDWCGRWCVWTNRGVWHDPRTHPASWELDPTEGPSRIRCRLQRCHLRMKPQFLLPQYQHRLSTHCLTASSSCTMFSQHSTQCLWMMNVMQLVVPNWHFITVAAAASYRTIITRQICQCILLCWTDDEHYDAFSLISCSIFIINCVFWAEKQKLLHQ